MKSFYSLLLYLFPRSYREEYGDELRTVSNLSLTDAMNGGWLEVVGVVLRELVGLPKAIIYQHLRERRKTKMTGKFASRFDFEPGSRNEILAALAPFLLIGALPTLMTYISKSVGLPMWIQIVFTLFMWVSVGGLLIIGFKKGVPRWFMPYLGLPMPIISVLLFGILMERLEGVWWFRLPWFLSDFLQQGLLWVGLIGSIVLLVAVVRSIPKFHPFYKRLRDDWTLLCFVLYGGMPFVLVLTFDEYKHDEPYMFLAFLILAVGGWFYLRNGDPWKKNLYLYVGVALSMLVAAVGKAVIRPIQDWPVYFDPSSWEPEAIRTMITWIWLALIMLLPLALKSLPRSDTNSETA